MIRTVCNANLYSWKWDWKAGGLKGYRFGIFKNTFLSYSSYTWHISRLITKTLIWSSFFYSSTTGILYFITDQKRWAPPSKFANVTLCTKFVRTCSEENNCQCTSLYGKFINVCMRYAHWWCIPVNFTFFEWIRVDHISIQNQEDYFLFGELNQLITGNVNSMYLSRLYS